MTWSNGVQASRIDRFYLNENINANFYYVKNINFTMSDHTLIISRLEYTEFGSFNINKLKKDTNWKLNENVLNDEFVNNKIIKICNEINDIKSKHNNEWYEIFISKIIKLLKRKSRKQSLIRKEKINFLFEKLSILDNGKSDQSLNKL